MQTFDTIVAGGGLGGTCAAIALARRGFRVLLLESGSFPRHKVCGEFLSPESRAILRRQGTLDEILAAGGSEITRARFVTPSASATAELPASALGLSRYALDGILWRAAGLAGVACRSRHKVGNITRSGSLFLVEAGGETFTAHSAIDATGRARLTHRQECSAGTEEAAASQRFLGLKAHFVPVHLASNVVELHFWQGGYCGLARVEGGAFNVCLLTGYPEHKSSAPDGNPAGEKENMPEQVWKSALLRNPELARRMAGATRLTPWLASANVQFSAHCPVDGNGVLRCGDASGYIHSLAGDGMAMALRSGELAAAVIAARLRGSLDTEAAARLYEAAWWREFGARLRYADRLSRLLLKPLPATAMIKFLSYTPGLANQLVRRTRGVAETV